MGLVTSSFCVKLHYAFQSKKHLYMVMDYCPAGDVGNLINKEKYLKESHAKIIAAEVLLALEHLHSQNIIYR